MIPIAKYGRREVAIGAVAWLVLSAASCTWLHWGVSIAWTVLFVWLVSFFRDPPRTIPSGPGLLVSPADGKVTDVTDLDSAEGLDGPAVRVGIFLNVFNVHLNRAPCDGRVVSAVHRPGRKINAMSPDAGQVNESQAVTLADTDLGTIVVRQIAGLIARRIVCDVKPGDRLTRGQIFGMIKFGSRTELILPRRAGLLIAVEVGQKVRAGRDVLARVTEALAGDTKSV